MVLFISRRKSHAQNIVNMFKNLGFPSYSATPKEALSEISPMYRAVIVVDPTEIVSVDELVKRLHSYVADIPVFAIYPKEFLKDRSDCFAKCYDDSGYAGILASDIGKYASERGLYHIGDYRLAGINANPDLGDIRYFDKPISFTRTEALIIRLLMRSYPSPRKAKSIIKYIYKPSAAPEEGSIRTHICSINKKFFAAEGKNLIKSIGYDGYVIYTPEIKEKYKI